MSSAIGQGKAYCRQAREIILNVLRYFTEEREKPSDPEAPKPTSAFQATLDATGVKTRQTLYKIQREGPVSPKKNGRKVKSIDEQMDDFDRGVVRRIINKMYTDKTWPTVKSVYERVTQETNFRGSQSAFYKLLRRMGYRYNKRSDRKFLKERPDIVAKRHQYLSMIKQIRGLTNCPVVYLDETFLHQNHTVGKCWQMNGEGGIKVPTGKGIRIIILHAGSKDGFVRNAELVFRSKSNSDDYHQEMNGDAFLQWFNEQFLPNLSPNSCIIMDNASYHSMREDEVPTMKSRKAVMQQWLTANKINFTPKMIKVQLYALIKEHKPRCTKYIIDEMAIKHGHFILRLPPYHPELNVIELIWAAIKGEVAMKNTTFKTKDVETLLHDAITHVTAESWRKAEDHVIKLEEHLYDTEVKIDTTLPEDQLNSFRFYVDDYSDDDSDDSDSDSDSEFELDDMHDYDMEVDDPEFEFDDDYVPEFPSWSEL